MRAACCSWPRDLGAETLERSSFLILLIVHPVARASATRTPANHIIDRLQNKYLLLYYTGIYSKHRQTEAQQYLTPYMKFHPSPFTISPS